MARSGRRSWLAAVLVVIGVVLTGVAFANASVRQRTDNAGTYAAQQPAPVGVQSITLRQAYDLALSGAQKWEADAELTSLNSEGANETPTSSVGSDGTRRGWQATAISPSLAGTTLSLVIMHGAVVSAAERQGSSSATALTEPMIDSPQALAAALAAKSTFGAASSGKGLGINFILQRGPAGNGSVVRIVGEYQSMSAFVDIDGSTGNIQGGQYHGYGQAAILHSEDGGITWSEGDLGGRMATSIAADPMGSATAYASAADMNGIVILRSEDGGATWRQVGSLPITAGTWPFALLAVKASQGNIATLVVGTSFGAWLSADGGSSWSQVEGLPNKPVVQLAAVRGSAQTVLFAEAVSNPQDPALYSSGDLANWTKVEDGMFSMSAAPDGSSVAALPESAGSVLAFDATNPQPPSTRSIAVNGSSGRVLRIGGKLGSGSLLAETSDGTWVSDDGGNNWQNTLISSLGSLAVAPDWDSSGLAIAGGFRSGIFRSADYGKHWQVVVKPEAMPATATRETVGICFLGPGKVIALNGGNLVWRDF